MTPPRPLLLRLAVAGWSLLAAGVAVAQATAPLAEPPPEKHHWFPEQFYDPEDGQFDMSKWLIEKKGFLPVPIIITEPAVGYGGGLGLAFFRESLGEAAAKAKETGRKQPPDIYGLAGFATENGTWGGAAGGMISSEDDKYRWRGGIVRTSVNLDFYGNGGRLPPIGYTLDGWGTVQHFMRKIGDSDAWVVGRWNYLDLDNRFDPNGDLSAFGPFERSSKASGLGISLEYDSRDNIFTPNRGWTGSIDLTFYDPGWGSDTSFQTYRAKVFSYWPASKEVILAGRVDFRSAEGDAPFYMLPFVDLRGVPAMRLQDTRTGVLEAEVRWNVTPRWAAIGFLGGGEAWGRSGDLGDGSSTFAKGVGFRYQLARYLGIWAGVDLAWSTQDKAFYIQVGNAWR